VAAVPVFWTITWLFSTPLAEDWFLATSGTLALLEPADAPECAHGARTANHHRAAARLQRRIGVLAADQLITDAGERGLLRGAPLRTGGGVILDVYGIGAGCQVDQREVCAQLLGRCCAGRYQ
jgi:hypothetical protein